MSIQEGTAPVELERISATASYHESLWGYRFLSNDLAHESQPQDLEEAGLRIEYDVLKEEVRKMLTRDDDHDNKETVEDKLQLIDTIQRLGVAYLFEAEIEGLNENIYSLGEDFIVKNNANIYHTALWFRLLRQQGFAISPNVFTKFKDNAGNFNEELASDVQGLLSLYEAAHLAGHGEDILDEALIFATNNLSRRSNNIEPSLRKQVKFALSLPVWKCVPRTLTRNYIDFYSDDNNTIDKQLLRFAKLDFNRLQKLHRQELREITEWWASLEVEAKFHYARNRIVECYYWIYAMYFEPEYHLARILATKMIAILTLLDDTFDGFGTVEQLDIFTQAIQTFDRSSLQSLPDAMKNIYRTLIDTYDEVEMELAKSGPTFGVDYAKEELKKLCRFYLIEIKTRSEGYVPTVEEHKKVSYVTGAVPFIFVGAFLGMGPELATREAYEWHANRPKIVEAVSIIGRLYNDVVSFQFERDRKHPASSVDCYMKEYNVSEEKAIELIWVEISKKWKDVAESCQKPIDVPVAIIDRILNFARSFNVIYKDGDGFTHSHLMKSEIASVFVDPIPLV
ncbi:Alpha-copaene synthase [Linum grandiflorum]